VANYTYTSDPDSAVKNKLRASTHEELEKREARIVFARTAEIEAGLGPSGSFDAAHLKAFHGHLFQDVYEWAGHTRDEKVELSDGTVATEPVLRKADGKPFTPGPQIAPALDRIATTLHDSGYLRGLPRAAFAEQAADIMAGINSVHAFREGNGRTQRTFMRELAKQAGHELDFSVVTRERMIQASIAANELADPAKMRRLFDEISDPVRVAALEKAIDALTQHGMKWNEIYIATAEAGHAIELTMAGVAGEQFMGRTSSQILIGQTRDLPKPQPDRGETFSFESSSWEHARPRTRGRGR